MGAGGGDLAHHLSENPGSVIHTLFPDCPAWSADRIDFSLPGINSWHQPWPSSSQGNKSTPATPPTTTSTPPPPPPTEQQFSSCGGSNRADPLILNGLAWALFYHQELQGFCMRAFFFLFPGNFFQKNAFTNECCALVYMLCSLDLQGDSAWFSSHWCLWETVALAVLTSFLISHGSRGSAKQVTQRPSWTPSACRTKVQIHLTSTEFYTSLLFYLNKHIHCL